MKDNYFLYVGNAYPHKNIEVLIKAATLAGVRVVYVGKNDYFYKKLGIVPMHATDSELKDLYKHAKALVFPSLMEGFGLPAVEALGQGSPVVVSDISIFHEILGDSAIYFNPRNPQELANILKSEIPKPKKLEKHFSWQKMAKETLKVYENSLSLRSGE